METVIPVCREHLLKVIILTALKALIGLLTAIQCPANLLWYSYRASSTGKYHLLRIQFVFWKLNLEITWDWDLSIFGIFDAWSHLLVCLVNIDALLNMAATWLSKSKGIAIPLFFAKEYVSWFQVQQAGKFNEILTNIRQGSYAIFHIKSLSGWQPRALWHSEGWLQ